MTQKTLTILGSTGTIGRNTIRLVEGNSNLRNTRPLSLRERVRVRAIEADFKITALTAGNNVELLAKQALTLNAEVAVIENEALYSDLKEALAGSNVKAAAGKKAILEAAAMDSDILISGIVGAAALLPTLEAVRRGAVIGLANKECLVCAGDLMMAEVIKHGATLIPVDSEHNAAFQSFEMGRADMVEKITLTASGGSFRKFTLAEMENVTPEQAVNHPNWDMGAKISVDSATMMNKGLEIIEAYHLFPVEKQEIDVVIHPESIIHSMVHYKDGSVIAGLSIPDMCVPISYALGWPNRMKFKAKTLNLADVGMLTFHKPDYDRFPALNLAKQALDVGGTAPAILNAANEIAVENFLAKKIGFLQISNVVEGALEEIAARVPKNIEEILEIDRMARVVAKKLIKKLEK